MGAIMLNGSRVGDNCLVGAGALITEGKTFPDKSLIVGSPARAVRTLDDEAIKNDRPRRRHLRAALQAIREGAKAALAAAYFASAVSGCATRRAAGPAAPGAGNADWSPEATPSGGLSNDVILGGEARTDFDFFSQIARDRDLS